MAWAVAASRAYGGNTALVASLALGCACLLPSIIDSVLHAGALSSIFTRRGAATEPSILFNLNWASCAGSSCCAPEAVSVFYNCGALVELSLESFEQ